MVKTSTSSSTTIEQSISSLSSIDEPKYKGVRKRKWGKWVSEIRLPNSRERIWLGSYDSPEKAARAFDAALFCLRGPGANFNFPENPPEIDISRPGGQSLSPPEIQRVAARYANEERPRTSLDHKVSSTELSQYTSSSSEGLVQMDLESEDTTIDWSFLGTLDNNERAVASDFGLFPGLDMDMDMNMNMSGDELYPPPPPMPTPTLPMTDDNGEDHENIFSQSSFLWNF